VTNSGERRTKADGDHPRQTTTSGGGEESCDTAIN
jgi:hypothetical protein